MNKNNNEIFAYGSEDGLYEIDFSNNDDILDDSTTDQLLLQIDEINFI